MIGTRLPGRWTPLPPHGGAGEIQHVAVAVGEAGVFLGVTSEDGPRILHGRLTGDDVEWSAPWIVPLPEHGGTPCGLAIAIDHLDPMRIAANRLEDQGGSFGLVVGRWGERFVAMPSPSDADLPFGLPMLLRGDELFTHDVTTAFFHYRGTDARTLPLPEGVDELGAHAGVDATGETIALAAFGALLLLTRTPAGDFRWNRRVDVSRPIDALYMSPRGHATILLDREGGFDVLTYDRDAREIGRRSVTTPKPVVTPPPPFENVAPRYGLLGERVVRETADGFFVFDVPGDRHVRLVGSSTVPWPPPSEAEIASSAWRDTVVLASREGIGLFVLAGQV